MECSVRNESWALHRGNLVPRFNLFKVFKSLDLPIVIREHKFIAAPLTYAFSDKQLVFNVSNVWFIAVLTNDERSRVLCDMTRESDLAGTAISVAARDVIHSQILILILNPVSRNRNSISHQRHFY